MNEASDQLVRLKMSIPYSVDSLRTVVCPVLVMHDNGELIPIGTSFIVGAMGGHAVLITAAHIFSEGAERIDRPYQRHHLTSPFPAPEPTVRVWNQITIKILAVDDAGSVFSFPVRAVGRGINLDLAMLFVDVPETSNFTFDTKLSIRSRGPTIDENTYAVGYYDLFDQTVDLWPPFLPKNLIAPDFFAVRGRLSCQEARVVELYPEGVRNKAWPAFSINVPFHSGMSGGPVLSVGDDENPRVCGVISSDLSLTQGKDELGSGEAATAAVLYPLLGCHFPESITYCYEENGNIVERKIRRLLDLVDQVAIFDHDNAGENLKFEIVNGQEIPIWISDDNE